MMAERPSNERSLQDAGRRRGRRRADDQEGLPEAGQGVPPRRHRRRQEEDRTLQGDQRGLRVLGDKKKRDGVRPAQARARCGPTACPRASTPTPSRRTFGGGRAAARGGVSSAATSTISATSSPACSASGGGGGRGAAVRRRTRTRPSRAAPTSSGTLDVTFAEAALGTQAHRPHGRRRRRSRSRSRPASRPAAACAFPGRAAPAPRQGRRAGRPLPRHRRSRPIRTCAATATTSSWTCR